MKNTKKLSAVISAFLSFVMCLSVLVFVPTEAKAYGETFIIDVGHGGDDPGALGPNGREEADDVLKLAMRVGEILAPYTTFVFTRTTDATLSLSQRSSMANAGGYKYIISIHRNAFTDPNSNGLEVWWYSGTYSGQQTACRNFATYVYDAVMEQVPYWRERGVKDGNLHMCRQPYMPSCLIETGFITNVNDNTIFDTYFEENAFGIAKGMLKMIGITPDSSAETWQEKACFDATIYKSAYSDLKNLTDEQLKEHWLNTGIKEGRHASVVLDLKYYAEQNQDLVAQYGKDYAKLYEHFITKGYKENRKSSLVFDGKYYCDNNADIANTHKDDYMRHYIQSGIKEGRRASETFDVNYYLFKRPDVANTWPGDLEAATKHFATYHEIENLIGYDDQPPVITNVVFSNISAAGYTVTCTVTDNWGVEFVSFPTWTIANGQDDLAADFFNTQCGTKNGDVYTFVVKASDHNNEGGFYATHIYAKDKGGYLVNVTPEALEVKDGAQDIVGEPKEITLNASSSYVKDGNVVTKVKTSTSVEKLLAEFENKALKVKDSAGNEMANSAYVGTGATVELYDGETLVDGVTISVLGDIDGNGIIDTTDYLRVKSAFLGTMNLDASQTLAADVDGNGYIDGTDYMRIKGQFLGTYKI